MILALYSLNVTTVYTSKLITVFTNPTRDHQMDSVEELLQSKIPIGGRLEYQDWFMNDGKEDGIILQVYNTSDSFQPSTTHLGEVVEGKKIILNSRVHVKSNKHADDIHGLTKNVFSSQLEIIVEKGFPLLPEFNKFIDCMTDTGLITKIYNDFLYNVTIIHKMLSNYELMKNKTNLMNGE